MKQVQLLQNDFTVSRLSFGTASIHHIPSNRQRQLLLAKAFEHGITHFDTSPYYGFGLAEKELGMFLKQRRGQITIATKIGLYPPHLKLINTATVWCRKLFGKAIPRLSRPVVDWSVATAVQSIEISLRRLKTDCIDLLLLHEPMLDIGKGEDILRCLQQQKQKGNIRAWGLAGLPTMVAGWLRIDHPLASILQVRDSLEHRDADIIMNESRKLQISYGYLSSAKFSKNFSARDIIIGALLRNRTGSVLVSTCRCRHLDILAKVATEAEKI